MPAIRIRRDKINLRVHSLRQSEFDSFCILLDYSTDHLFKRVFFICRTRLENYRNSKILQFIIISYPLLFEIYPRV